MRSPSLQEAIPHMLHVVENCEKRALFAAIVDMNGYVIATQCFIAPNDDWSCLSMREVFDFAARWQGMKVVTLSRASRGTHATGERDGMLVDRLRAEGRRRMIAWDRHVFGRL